MARAGNLQRIRGRAGLTVLALLAALFAALAAAGSTALAAPFEPNDTLLTASGPLAIGQTYPAAVEMPGDRDFFFFYVTAAAGSQVGLTLANLGGGTAISDVDARIVDSSGASLGADLPYVAKGESRTAATVTLKPGKYFVEIAAKEGYGDSYAFSTGGSAGAYGGYAEIAARCATATSSVKRLEGGVRKAEAKLERATGRLRGSRFDGPNARRAVRSAYLKAKARVAAKRRSLRAAADGRRPWCFIPQ